jgi:hypothetical protein
VGAVDLAFQQYEFTMEGRPIHVFHGIYEDATGGTILASRRQNAAARMAAALAGSRNYGQRFLELVVSGYDDAAGDWVGVVEQLAGIISPARQILKFPRPLPFAPDPPFLTPHG